jgi:SAM-dependent methyltransferase
VLGAWIDKFHQNGQNQQPQNYQFYTNDQNQITLKVLNLCANDNTYKQKKYVDNVEYIYNKYFHQKVETEVYYVGDKLTIENAHDACTADLSNTEEPFNEVCKYNPNTFDMIISEGCPVRGDDNMSVFNENTFEVIKSILKPNGFLLLMTNRKFNSSYQIGERRITNLVRYMEQRQKFRFVENIQTHNTYVDEESKRKTLDVFFQLFQNQK